MIDTKMLSIVTCRKCKKEIFVISANVDACDKCREYSQQDSEMLD